MYFVDSSANIVRCLQTFPGKRREIREIPTNIPTPSKSIPKISRFYNNKMVASFASQNFYPQIDPRSSKEIIPSNPQKFLSKIDLRSNTKKKKETHRYPILSLTPPPQEKILVRERKDEFLEQVPPTNFSIPLSFYYGTLQADEIKEIAPRMSSL